MHKYKALECMSPIPFTHAHGKPSVCTRTHANINTRKQHTETSTHANINTRKHQHTQTSTHGNINTRKHQHTETSTHGNINTRKHQHTETSTHGNIHITEWSVISNQRPPDIFQLFQVFTRLSR